MSPPIVFVNSSQRLKGREPLLQLLAQLVQAQLTRHLCPAWGRTPPSVTFTQNPLQLPFGARVMWFKDKLDVPDALGYHTETARGVIYGVVGVDAVLDAPGATDLSGPDSLLATTSHEACEMVINDRVNLLVSGPDGYSYDYEVSDWVEGDGYEVEQGGHHGTVSNFVFPEAFDANMVGRRTRFDQMGTLRAPFTMTDGGYMPRYDAHGADATVYGRLMPEWKVARKRVARRAHRVREVATSMRLTVT